MEFETPIEIRVTPGASPKIFESFERFSGWAKQQLTAWERFGRAWQAHGPEYTLPGPIFRVLMTQKTEWALAADGRLLSSRKYDLPEHKEFERHINRSLSRRKLLAVEQPLVERALNLAAIDPEAAGMVLVIASDVVEKILEESKADPQTLAYFGRAVAYLSTTTAYDAALSDHLEAVEKIAAGIRQNESERLKMEDASVNALGKFDADSKKRIDAFDNKSQECFLGIAARLTDIESEWGRLRETYDRMLKLSEPRKYWSDKLTEHERIYKRWRSAFVAVCSASTIVLAASTAIMVSQGASFSQSIGVHTWVLPVMLLGAPAFVTLWLLRICGRQWQDHLFRMEDARERVVMVETFLALSRSDASPNSIGDPAQLSVVLGSIFRAGPGFTAEDGPPVSLLDALAAKIGGKN
jgi:hypothetical protein